MFVSWGAEWVFTFSVPFVAWNLYHSGKFTCTNGIAKIVPSKRWNLYEVLCMRIQYRRSEIRKWKYYIQIYYYIYTYHWCKTLKNSESTLDTEFTSGLNFTSRKNIDYFSFKKMQFVRRKFSDIFEDIITKMALFFLGDGFYCNFFIQHELYEEIRKESNLFGLISKCGTSNEIIFKLLLPC